MDKKGMGAFAIIGTVFMVVLILAGGWFVVKQSGFDNGNPNNPPVGGDCETLPYVTLSALNESTKSQTVAPVYNHQANGVYRGALTSGSAGTTFNIGDKVRIVTVLSGYRDMILDSENAVGTFEGDELLISKCGSNDVSFDIAYDASGGTFLAFNSAGVQVVDSAVGTAGTNQSKVGAGTTKNMEIQLTSGGKENIDPTWISVEINNKTMVNDLSLGAITSGLTVEEKVTPKFFSSENTTTSSYVEFWRISGLRKEGNLNQMSLTLKASDSYDIASASAYVNGYSEEAFVDDDGTFKYGVEDKSGDTKYSSKYTDYDFFIQST